VTLTRASGTLHGKKLIWKRQSDFTVNEHVKVPQEMKAAKSHRLKTKMINNNIEFD
jgi:hypothetical protein